MNSRGKLMRHAFINTGLVSLCVALSGMATAVDTSASAKARASGTAMAAADARMAAAQTPDPALVKAVADPARSARFVARDRYRHPAEELTFFGLKPNMTVVEVWPGSGYWTEILGPYLKSSGHYYAAVTVKGESQEEDTTTAKWRTRIEQEKDRFGNITITGLGKGHYEVAPANSADMVVTFRNLHNWDEAGYAQDALKGIYTALKPGGILGIEDHRGRTDKPQSEQTKTGYIRQDYTIEMAKKAGFEFVGASEINANPKDTKDYPEGVWTLPPTLTLGDKDREKYLAIGESDNYVLKFRKPAH
jgi:predicted methyltransferase